MNQRISDTVALLAPVPSFHLVSGLQALSEAGGILFASDAFTAFHNLEHAREGKSVTVWIYESFGDSKLEVKWKGTYVGFVSSDDRGQLKTKKKMRPKSTENDGKTALYWELCHLEKLTHPIPLTEFYGLGNQKAFQSDFVPRGPILIEPSLV